MLNEIISEKTTHFKSKHFFIPKDISYRYLTRFFSE